MHLLVGTSYLLRLTYYNLPIYVSNTLKNSNSFNVICWNKIHGSWLQYVVQNHVHYNYVIQKYHLMEWWCNG
jgi:hypothetical protein